MFKARLREMLNRRGDEFAESAIAFPIVILLVMAMINLSLAGFASVNAANAANYGARVGSVYQQGSAGAAYSAAQESISRAPVGSYQVAVSGGGFPGATLLVSVTWTVPNYMAPIMAFFGSSSAGKLGGTVSATFRQEGW
jgi:hypothetical protein